MELGQAGRAERRRVKVEIFENTTEAKPGRGGRGAEVGGDFRKYDLDTNRFRDGRAWRKDQAAEVNQWERSASEARGGAGSYSE